MELTTVERDDDIRHVLLVGRLDTTGVEEISQSFAAAIESSAGPTIVDLSGIDFMASRGIGMLLASGKRLIKAGFRLVLLNPRELVESVLTTTKIDQVLPITRDLNGAIQILRGGSVEPTARPAQLAEDEAHTRRSERSAGGAAEGELKLTIKNELSELKDLSARLAEFLRAHGVPNKSAYAVNLAIDELVVNVIRYAYVDDETHWIDIELGIEGEQIILRIADDGRPFDPRTGPSLDVHAEEREVGGLGLILVLDMVDMLNYRRVDDRNLVEVRVHLVSEDVNSDRAEPA